MSVSLTRFSWWYWCNGKEKEPTISSGSSSDSMKLSSSKKKGTNLTSSSSSKKVKKKWQSREERKRLVDKEYDVVLVPSDGVCLSESEESSYDSDWSIGWMEPHAHEFLQSDSDDVSDNSFAVLVPCYRNDCKAFKMEEEPSNQLLSVLSKLPTGFPAAAEGNEYMEQWLASLQNL
ncbi:uncharacterized protein LOC112513799 [Cynara cardunculus var. scolymus]|uniref:Uncharacterized protein n=1 Tax=Cynara cardunculus var. scolymus TaxID=59895 RepID=A0A124SFG6_CYNCS|nr:uncharacterized protein LOC112513799 [Cynara cardunculus var. scolymus]KVI03168.1 hypothetical protein Ccrd_018537 [Cynara cardunculus var. scolymus]